MRPLRYSINVTLDGCVSHLAGTPNEQTHRHAATAIANNDAILLGRVTYQMMEDGWRATPAPGTRPAWMEPFAKTINATTKYVVSSTLKSVDWNAQLLHGELKTAVEMLKQQPGTGIGTGGVTLPTRLAELGLIDEYDLVVHPRVAGHGPYLLAGLTTRLDLTLVDRVELGDGIVAMQYRPRR